MNIGTRNSLLWIALCCCACATSERSRPPAALDIVEDLRIGSVDDPETSLTFVQAIVPDADGRIFSMHFGEAFLRVHDGEGRPVMRIGREGEGPGEFRTPRSFGFVGDSLWVYDGRLSRFSFFDRQTGRFLTSRDIRIDLGTDPAHSPARPNGLLADGSPYGSPPAWSSAVASGELAETVLVRMDWAGASHDTIARYSIANTSWELTEKGPRAFASYRQQPFSDGPLVRVSTRFDEIVRVDRRADAEPPEFSVSRITFGGDTAWTRRYAWTPRPIPDALADSIVRSFAAGLGRTSFPGAPTVARGEELARGSLYRPAAMPPVADLVIGADGSIWLKRDTEGPTSEWWILSESGETVGVVTIDAGTRILAPAIDHAWGVVTDDLDVPYIVRYRVAVGN